MEDDKNGAAVKFPPPLIFLFLLLAAYGLQHIWPIGIGASSGLKYIGGGVVMLGIGIVILVAQSFKNAETNIEPWKPTTKIISTGIYAYSRNPIYAGFCLVSIGIGIFSNSFWILISFIPSAVLVYYIAIRKEEVYLEKNSGKSIYIIRTR
ncbi:MAG: isoprenylcysteine carboxylmethyltransferase family protein [Proteobacteria bacterium]|nr:isoprenylcysteine carboxylmethyltransferase family protein [Pseudomonadota bacterium]